ncbi:hypothetical protein [Oceanobacillus bengalensis]|uniref:hypothetical protein n=1 Tax=Oceanobacillus bengalensis TaxID=1435466 RepID=UPI0016036252|nr:hypothetical protein [Oceanobacillus bengalensis]
MSVKQEVLKMVQDLPENVSAEEILRELYIYIRFQEGVQEINEERTKVIHLEPRKIVH